MLSGATQSSPFRSFKTSPEVIRLVVMLYVRFPLSLPNVEDLLHERGAKVSYETVRFCRVCLARAPQWPGAFCASALEPPTTC